MSLQSSEGTPLSSHSSSERLVRPRIESLSQDADTVRMMERQTDLGLRVLLNITRERSAKIPENSLQSAIEANHEGMRTLSTIGQLRFQGEGPTVDTNNLPKPLTLEHQVSVKDTQGNTLIVKEVSGRNRDFFLCSTINPETGQIEKDDIAIPRSELLRGELLASKAELEEILSGSDVTPEDKQTVEDMIKVIDGRADSLGIEESMKDPVKREQLEKSLTKKEHEAGMITTNDLMSLVDKIAPYRDMPQGAVPDTVTFVEEGNAKRTKLIDIISNSTLSVGEKAVKILRTDLPSQKTSLKKELSRLKQQMETVAGNDKQVLQKQINDMTDMIASIDIFEKQINPEEGQPNEFARMFDDIQDGLSDPQTAAGVKEALRENNIDSFINTFFPDIADNVKDTREEQELKMLRKKRLKKYGGASLLMMLALLAGGIAIGSKAMGQATR